MAQSRGVDGTGLDGPEALPAFAAFFNAYADRARRLAYRLLGGDLDGADDVVQDAFLKAFRALPHFRRDASLQTWFFRILVREAHNHRRRRLLRQSLRWGWGEEAPAVDSHRDPVLRRRVGEAINALSRRQREVFVLVYLEELTVAEAAAVIGCSDGTVKTQLYRARQKLQAQLRDVGAGEALEGTGATRRRNANKVDA